MGRANDCERLVRCAAGACCAIRGLEDWETEQYRLLETVYEQARGGLGPTVPKRVAARVLAVSVSTLDRWAARGMLDTGGAPRSERQEISTDMVIELACELRLPDRPTGHRFQAALGRVWQQRLRNHEDDHAVGHPPDVSARGRYRRPNALRCASGEDGAVCHTVGVGRLGIAVDRQPAHPFRLGDVDQANVEHARSVEQMPQPRVGVSPAFKRLVSGQPHPEQPRHRALRDTPFDTQRRQPRADPGLIRVACGHAVHRTRRGSGPGARVRSRRLPMQDMARSVDSMLDLVAAITALARPADPTRCSMRAFNDARGGSPFPDAPTANAIHLAFNKHTTGGRSWRQIVELAFAAPADRIGVLRAGTRVDQQPWVTRRHLFFALNRVARSLDVPTLIPREYETARAALIREARHRDADSELAELLPTEGQIERIARLEREQAGDQRPWMSDWDYALEIAGLTARAERVPARRRVESRRLPLAHGAAIFGAVNSVLPSAAALNEFAAATAIKLQAKPAGGWPEVLAVAETLLRDAGLPVPERPRPVGRAGRPALVVPADPLDFAAVEEALTHEQAVEVLRVWDREQPGRGRTQRQSAAWQVGSQHPALATLQRVAPFSELRAEALKLNTAGAAPLCALADRETAGVTPALLRAIAAGPARTIGRAPAAKDRPVFRGPRPWLSHLIAAGLVSVDEQLVAEHAGKRYTATFNADGDITVTGRSEPVATLNQAVALVTDSKLGGWQFWTVRRAGLSVPLSELRDMLRELPGEHRPRGRRPTVDAGPRAHLGGAA